MDIITNTGIKIHIPSNKRLPDGPLWKNRFEIRSSSSNRVYIVSQNIASGKWGCSCPSYRVRRYCKHLLQGCSLTHNQIHGHDLMEEKKAKATLG